MIRRFVNNWFLMVIFAAIVPPTTVFADDPTQSPPAQTEAIKPLSTVSDEEFENRCRWLFDGTILTRWEGNAYWFHTEGTAVVAGRLEEKIPENQFLCTTDTFDNFDLRMEVRMRGTGRNAGVQFRSRRPNASDNGIPPNEVIGYQADMGEGGGESIWGALYDESRRKKMLVVPDPRFDVQWKTPQGPESASSAVPETDWITLRIVCVDDQIEIYLGGQRTIRYTETDPEIARSGVIGLQIHSGPPAEAWYRNVRILSL
ncbi:3-keto-disaccharide hydrolase [Neorhodopirellula pilleata]|uniref:3-keto-alpha-glucoside-1,2-lyase/3-keto-2-hydroxy-glucal hydratase domain-containing protein n=1 Tax=Neorhodopirellula pilleata TaxID=2714738 RepID=A0A5C6A8U3_9BACT|nr:DUF1080 domain-containing protein [Neorhodopirellula pilleata]TWT95738.1 hypothetical protein Pla100_33800 [Neorhodopirellula pilleata]